MKRLFSILLCLLCAPIAYGQNGIDILHEEDEQTSASHQIVWDIQPGVHYRLECSTNLTDWMIIESFPLAATNMILQVPISTGGEKMFYRVGRLDDATEAFVLIPAGTFTMGSPEDEPGHWRNETQHKVTISRNIYLQSTEVTWAQWNKVRDWALENGYADLAPGRNNYEGDDSGKYPVRDVSWYDVVKWLNALSEKQGREPCYRVDGEVYRVGESDGVVCDWQASGYRLPTEAEWEYACRAGATTAFHTGEIIHTGDSPIDPNLDQAGWYRGNSGGKIHPVGQKQPNSWGLFDMHGNVWEWCWDWYEEFYGFEVVDPKGPDSGSFKVRRGGGRSSFSQYCRSAGRSLIDPGDHNNGLGFRPALCETPEGFVVIPAGTFTMGSPEDEAGRWNDEAQHQVTITADFYMKSTEVTWPQWNEVRDWALQNGYTDLAPGSNGHESYNSGIHPMAEVSWNDVVKWLNAWSEKQWREPCYRVDGEVYRVGESDGVVCDWQASGYRLPTEAEWEYACRAGATTAFYTGEIIHAGDSPVDPNLDQAGWYWGNSRSRTHPVRQKQANSWGLYDMQGNVWEWCWDWYENYETSPVSNPKGPGSGSERVIRGGSFISPAKNCRSAYRAYEETANHNAVLGFRPVLSSAP